MASPILHLPATNCLIRPFNLTPTEAQSLTKQANNPLIAKYMRNVFPHPYSLSDAESRLSFVTSQSPQYDFAICDAATNTLIGSIGLVPRSDIQHRTMEIGYWVGQDYWGRGIGTEALRAFSKWSFETFGHVVRLEAVVFGTNAGSMKVLERAGFVIEGRKRWGVEKDGVLLDLVLYALLREDINGVE